jgi:iron complex transport system permease protein
MRTSYKYRLIGLFVLFVISAILEVAIGPISIRFTNVVSKTIQYMMGSQDEQAIVIGAIRLPRMLVASFVGAGLASTGAVLQAIFRNPMADPSIIGVSSGGSLGAVAIISIGIGNTIPWSISAGAFVSGVVAVFVIYFLGTVGGRTAIHTLLLAGVAVSSFCSAIVTLLLSLSPLETTKEMLFWLMGGLDGSTWDHVWIIVSFVSLGVLIYLSQSKALDILSIGEEQAEGVGVYAQNVKLIILVTSGIVTGACVSVTGVVGFVGLIVPHVIRIWLGPAHRFLIPASVLGGAILLNVSDLIARMVLLPIELNVGIVTACLGAPFFLYLLRRQYAASMRR